MSIASIAFASFSRSGANSAPSPDPAPKASNKNKLGRAFPILVPIIETHTSIADSRTTWLHGLLMKRHSGSTDLLVLYVAKGSSAPETQSGRDVTRGLLSWSCAVLQSDLAGTLLCHVSLDKNSIFPMVQPLISRAAPPFCRSDHEAGTHEPGSKIRRISL